MTGHDRPVIGFVLPHMKAGGIEAVVRVLLNRLDRTRWRPKLFLNRIEGEFLQEIADDVPIHGVGGHRLLVRAARLASLLRRERVQVAYSGTNAMNLSLALALRLMPRSARPRCIVTEHTTAREYLAEARLPAVRRILVRRLYPGADLLGSPLPEIAEGWLRELSLTRPAPVWLPNPVFDGTAAEQLRSSPPATAPFRIVAAGRLAPVKAHNDLIDAFARVRASLRAANLVIYGEGPQRPELERRVADHGLAGAVSLPGHSDRLMHELATASVVALPSRREGFGNVVVEAMAAGVPVVATDCMGPRVLLKNGELGRLVPPGDPPALASALVETMLSPPPPEVLQRAAETVSRYEINRAVGVFDDLLRRLCREPSLPT